MKRLLSPYCMAAAMAALAAGCAMATPPFASPEDVALKEKAESVVALYSNVVDVSAANGNVYLSGNCVEIYGEVERIIAAVEQIDGVKKVFSEVRTCGNDKGDKDYD